MASRMVIPSTAFAATSRKTKRQRVGGNDHLAFIKKLPCLVSGRHGCTEVAHVSYEDLRGGKLGRGLGSREEHCWVVPLSFYEHKRQHAMSERAYWEEVKIDPVYVALALWRCTGDAETALIILAAHRTM